MITKDFASMLVSHFDCLVQVDDNEILAVIKTGAEEDQEPYEAFSFYCPNKKTPLQAVCLGNFSSRDEAWDLIGDADPVDILPAYDWLKLTLENRASRRMELAG